MEAAVKEAVGSCGGDTSVEVGRALVENGSRCAVNSKSEKVLPDQSVILTTLMTKVVQIVTDEETAECALEHDDSTSMLDCDMYAKKHRWAIWPLLLLHAFVIKPLVVRKIKS